MNLRLFQPLFIILILVFSTITVEAQDWDALNACVAKCDCSSNHIPGTIAYSNCYDCTNDCMSQYGEPSGDSSSDSIIDSRSQEEIEREVEEKMQERLEKALRRRARIEAAKAAKKAYLKREREINQLMTNINDAMRKMKDSGLTGNELLNTLINLDLLMQRLTAKGDYENIERLKKIKEKVEFGLKKIDQRKREIMEEKRKEAELKRQKEEKEARLRAERDETLKKLQESYDYLRKKNQLTDEDIKNIGDILDELNKLNIKWSWKHKEFMKLGDEDGKKIMMEYIMALEDQEAAYKSFLPPGALNRYGTERTLEEVREVGDRLEHYLKLRKYNWDLPSDVRREINDWILDPKITKMDPELRAELDDAKKNNAEAIGLRHEIKKLEKEAMGQFGIRQAEKIKKIKQLKKEYEDKEQEIITQYGRILLDHPGDEEANFALGTIYKNKGKNEEARVLYRRALWNAKPIPKYLMEQELRDQQVKVKEDLNIENLPPPEKSPIFRNLKKSVNERLEGISKELYARVRHSEIVSRGIAYSQKVYQNYQTVKGIFTGPKKEDVQGAAE